MRRLWLVLILLATPALAQRSIPVDTTAIVLRIWNLHPSAVRVYLETSDDTRRVGEVPARYEAYYILHGRDIKKVERFLVTVAPVDSTINPYHTGLIIRNQFRITTVYVRVGEDSSGLPSLPRLQS